MAACLLAGAVPGTALAASSRHTLRDSAPDWAKPSAKVGAVPNSERQDFWVYLKLRDSSGLDALISSVSDPASASYGNFISAAHFRAHYAPTSADVASVRRWLRGSGFTVSRDVPANRRWVHASGDVATIEKAFGTQLRTYRHEGKTLQAPAGDLKVPTAVAGVVAGVAGLDGSDSLMRPRSSAAKARASAVAQDLPGAPPSPGFANAGPCSSFFGEKTATGTPPAYGRVQPYVTCGYVPAQLQGAYGLTAPIKAGLDGRGQTVAIVDAFASPTIQQDADTYATRHGQGPVSLEQIVPAGIYDVPEDEPTGCDPQGWYGEETLDVEAVHAVAPGAKIVYSGGQDCTDESLIAAVNKVVDGQRAQMVTNSYGDIGEAEPAGLEQAWTDTFRQAAAQGIGMYFSSGDDGDEVVATGGVRTVDFPASHPLVTAVGGTTLGVGAANDYQFETGWGTASSTLTDGAWDPAPPGDYLYGAGGGTSLRYPEPRYQKAVVPQALSGYYSAAGGRVVPDVSMVGDPNTGMLIGQTQTFTNGTRYGEYRIGGTSLSSPLFAGVMALADQAARRPHGFANPLLYARAGSGAFRDVFGATTPVAEVRNDFVNQEDASGGIRTTLRTADQTGTLDTTPGYDDVTGIGSPKGVAFLAALAKRGR